MKKILFVSCLVISFALEVAFASHANKIEVKDAWARKSIMPNNNSAVYMKIINLDDHDVEILGAKNSDISDDIELHKSFVDEKGVSRMVALDKIVLPKGADIELAPGAIHIMLLNLKAPLKSGDHFPLTLNLSDGLNLEIDVEVK